MMKKNFVSVNFELYLLAAYDASFTSKDGKEIKLYKGVIRATRGVHELRLSKELFDEVVSIVPANVGVSVTVDLENDKIVLDTLK